MKEQLERINSFPVGLNNWFFFIAIVLFSYGCLLQAGSPRFEADTPQAASPRDTVQISIDVAAHPPEKSKKPLKLNIKKSKRFQRIIDQAGDRYAVDPDLIRAVIMAESGYNPKAVSHRGARGLMQLMPKTAEAMGVKDSFNPEHNIDGGVRYLKKLLTRYDGNVELALAAYNAGSRKVRQYQGIPPYKATRTYIRKVSEYFFFYKNYMSNKLNNV